MLSKPQKPRQAGNALALLLLFYLTGTILRFGLCLLLSQNVSIMPDEALYSNLARRLWTNGEVALRGQPLKYESLEQFAQITEERRLA